jgi:lipoyl-dependent peroxiredoxin subunit D
MDALDEINAALPDTAKDVRLNLDSVVRRSSLRPDIALGCALSAAFAARSDRLLTAFKASLTQEEAEGALAAAALMGMNNVWYPFVEMAGDDELKHMRAELRMNAYANHGGVEKARFEAYALSASIVGKCRYCIRSHYELLQKEGWTTQQLRDVGRIAAVVNATAMVLSQEP